MSGMWMWIEWIGLILAILAGGHAMLHKRSPTSAALWICVNFLLPIVGPVLYLLLGINRTVRRARRKMPPPAHSLARRSTIRKPEHLPEPMRHLESLVNLGDRIGLEPFVGGNHLEPLMDGEDTYSAMLMAIDSAKRSITCCTYIFNTDHIGRKFVDAFKAASNRGVKIKLLVDGLGSWGHAGRVGEWIKSEGIQYANFAPIGLTPTRLMHINLRNHRKIMVVDGTMAFTGGINITADQLAHVRRNPQRYHDMQFAVRGPIVRQLQNVFADDWAFATGEDLEGDDFFPPTQAAGEMIARVVADGPDQPLRILQWVFITACQSAKRTLRIMTPYFIPAPDVKSAIIGAALRGVDVLLVLPRVTDAQFSTWATMAYLWEFLQHGVRVVLIGPPWHHTKVTVVDESWTFVGSANLDPRSLRLNFECNCEILDSVLGQRMASAIDTLAARHTPITLAMVDGRPAWMRVRDSFCKLFSPYL